MPVGMDTIHPFLGAIAAGRAVKEIICSRISLVKKGNKIVFHSSFLSHIEAELPVHDPVYAFMDKKRAQGKPYYVYMTAGANKFLRIYYGRVKEYLSTLPESEEI